MCVTHTKGVTMAAIDEVCAYLKKCGTYYLATTDGDQPRVRPFGTAHIYNGKLYIQTGKSKDVSRQIEANPKFEISGMVEGTWIRVSGSLVGDDSLEATSSMLEAYPSLKSMYAPGDGNTIVYGIEHGRATFCSFTEPPRTVEF